MSLWDPIGDVGGVLSGAAGGAAAGRLQDTNLAQRADELALQRYLDSIQGANLDLNQRKFAVGTPGVRAGQAVRGDILANSQDVNISGLPSYITKPTMTGGLRPSMLSQNSRNMGTEMSRQALLNQMKGDIFAPQQPLPILSTPEQASRWERSAGIGGTLAGLLAALAGAGKIGVGGGFGGPGSGGEFDLTKALNKLKSWFSDKGDVGDDYDFGSETTVPWPGDDYDFGSETTVPWPGDDYDYGPETTVPDDWIDAWGPEVDPKWFDGSTSFGPNGELQFPF